MPIPEPNDYLWSKGLSPEAKLLVDTLKSEGNLGLIVDCGAGVGRHAIYAAKEGADRVVAIERDPEQVEVIRQKKEEDMGLANLEIVGGNVLKSLEQAGDNSVDGMIDCGFSHCLTDVAQREAFARLAYSKLKPGGLFSITHFSEKEELSKDHFKVKGLEDLRRLFPEDKWTDETRPWREENWPGEKEGGKHYAYKAVLKKR